MAKHGEVRTPEQKPAPPKASESPMSIKLPAVLEQLVRLYAQLGHTTYTQLITECIEESLDQVIQRHLSKDPTAMELLERLARQAHQAQVPHQPKQ